jgi:chemotaxis protein CheC
MTVLPSFLDPMTELINIGVGKAAGVLNTMLDTHVKLSVPSLRVVTPGELSAVLGSRGGDELSAVEMEFSGDFSGCAELVFGASEAGKLVDLITAGMGLADEDLDSIRAGTLCEVGNILINAVLGTMVNLVASEVSYTVPIFIQGSPDEVIAHVAAEAEVIIMVTSRFDIESLKIEGDILLFLSLSTFTRLEAALARFSHG